MSMTKQMVGYLFASCQVGDVSPALLGRHNAEDDAFGKWVHAINEFQFSISSKRDHLSNTTFNSSSGGNTVPLTWYISLSLREIVLKPAMNSSSRCFRNESYFCFSASRRAVVSSRSFARRKNSSSRL